MLGWLEPQLPDALRSGLHARRDAARQPPQQPTAPSTISEVQLEPASAQPDEATGAAGDGPEEDRQTLTASLFIGITLVLLLLTLGIWRGRGRNPAR